MSRGSSSDAAVAPTVSVVVPVFNSEQTLRPLCDRIVAALAPITSAHEIILVNDGSRDGSWAEISALIEQLPAVRGIDLMRNFGQHNALLCGIRLARFDVTVTLDDDLQNPPEEIPRLLAALERDADVVYGAPKQSRYGLLRATATILTKWVLQGAMGSEAARQISAFRAFRTRLRDAFAHYAGDFVSIDVLLTWGTNRFVAVPVDHDPRTIGASQYTLRKLVTYTLTVLTGFSTLPLQLASVIGLSAAVFGIFILGWVVLRTLIQGVAVPGFAFIASIVTIFAGAQLFSIGVIGEYLGRIHVRSMDRPAYVILQSIDGKPPTDEQ